MSDWLDGLLVLFTCGVAFVVLATWRALPLLLVASLVDLTLRRRLAAKWHAALWSLVVIRLALPFSLPIPWSPHASLDDAFAAVWTAAFAEERSSDDRAEAIAYAAPGENADGVQSFPPANEFDAARAQGPDSAPVQTVPPWDYFVAGTLGIGWALVAIGLILRGAIAHVRFARRLRSARTIDDPAALGSLRGECKELRVRRVPRLVETPDVLAPAAFGLFRISICLPVGALETLSPDELRWALRHELAHVRRRDAWLTSFAALVGALQWCNPIAWLVLARLRSHIEASADDLALSSATAADANAYGRLLLKCAEGAVSRRSSPALGLLPFVAKGRLRERIDRLTRLRADRPREAWRGWSIAVATVALAIVGLTDRSYGSSSESTRVPPPFPLQGNAFIETFDEATGGPTTLREYDVAEALDRIEAATPGERATMLIAAAKLGLPEVREIRLEGERLVAELAEAEHRELAARLDAWNAVGLQQIVVETRFLMPELESISPIDWNPVGVEQRENARWLPVVATRFSEENLIRLLREVQYPIGSNILFAPKATTFAGQSTTYADVSRTPFVVAVEPLAEGAMRPVVETLEEGIRIRHRARPLSDGQIELTVEVSVSRIDAVSEVQLPFRNPAAPTATTTVQAPKGSTATARCTVRLTPPESLLLAIPQAGPATPDRPKRATFIAFSPYPIDE